MKATVGKDGRRCGAMTQKGTPCRNLAMVGGRCWLHGGGKRADRVSTEAENDQVLDTRTAGEPEEPKFERAAAMASGLETPSDEPEQNADEMVPELFMTGEDRAGHLASSDKRFHMSELRVELVKETVDQGFSDRWELNATTGAVETGSSAAFGKVFADENPAALLMKKQVSLPLYVLLAVLISVILSAGGLFYGVGRNAGDAGNLDINAINVSTQIVENSHIGSLFVISGEVLNGYDHKRSYIRISGRLFLKGNFSKTETVYCGNILSGEELAQSSWDAITERLAHKTGDGDTNEEIAAGGTLPFMVVFSELPDNLKELERYTVEVTGSDGP